MSAMAALLVMLLALGVPAIVALNSYAGPYIAYAKRFYQCIEKCQMEWDVRIRVSHFNPYKPRELQRLTGYINVRNETGADGLTDALWFHVILDSRSNNQWKQNAFVMMMPAACSSGREHLPDVFRVFFSGISLRGKCQVPPGNYSFVNQPVRWLFPHIPILPYGEYRIRVTIGQVGSDTPLGCGCVDSVTIPKI